LDERFSVTRKTIADAVWYQLKPKKAESTFAVIMLQFSDNRIHAMRLQDHLGHTTQIEFKQVIVNPRLPADLFQYQSTSQMDVIDETR
jgi:outer membrane lipoprotein carrier protein